MSQRTEIYGLSVAKELFDFIENHALQCGYCTPGFLMLATGILEAQPDILSLIHI